MILKEVELTNTYQGHNKVYHIVHLQEDDTHTVIAFWGRIGERKGLRFQRKYEGRFLGSANQCFRLLVKAKYSKGYSINNGPYHVTPSDIVGLLFL